MRPQTGVALVIVLWVVAILSLMAASFGLGVRREAYFMRHLAETGQLRAAAEAAIHYAAFMLTLPEELRWRADGSVYALKLDEFDLRIQLADEAGKIDLNRADEGMLRAVLTHLTQEEAQAAALASAILDWRDGDQDRHVNGAEAEDYRAAGLPYGPADAFFASAVEVGLVLGMTPALTRALLPLVTVHSGQPGINPQVAQPEVLLALGGDPSSVDAFVDSRKLAPILPTLPGVNFHSIQGVAVGVNVEVRRQAEAFQLQAVIRPGEEIEYLDWREIPLPKSLFELKPQEPADRN
jgi:general secretion pathway protein K